MGEPPRDPCELMLARRHGWSIFTLGGVIALSLPAALGVSVRWLEKPAREATTLAVGTSLVQLIAGLLTLLRCRL